MKTAFLVMLVVALFVAAVFALNGLADVAMGSRRGALELSIMVAEAKIIGNGMTMTALMQGGYPPQELDELLRKNEESLKILEQAEKKLQSLSFLQEAFSRNATKEILDLIVSSVKLSAYVREKLDMILNPPSSHDF
jgi:hypothetical protein